MKPVQLPSPSPDPNYSAIDPLDSRYYDPEIATYLSEASRIAYQAHVEAALANALAGSGICPAGVAKEIGEAAAKVTAEAVAKEEKTTKHDVKALVNCIKAGVSEEAQPFVHFGATSYDIVATALSLQLRTATRELVIPRLAELEKTLLKLTKKYADTVQIGRTHGQHAVPVTFGFAMAEYVSRLGGSMRSLEVLSGKLPGKFSGAVGAYNALSLFVDDPQKFEKTLLEQLELEPAPYSTQIVPPEYVIRLLDELAVTAGIMANLAHDMRHLQRSEIAEIREHFDPGQTGSSTMAHKRNPWNFENVVSMAKQVTAQLVNANLNISSEHQRDLTDSASARFYTIPLASVASMASRLNGVMSKIEVDDANMKRNLYASAGAIAAEPLYLLLEKYGHTRAHEVSKELSHKALEQKRPLFEIVQEAAEIKPYFEKFTEDERRILHDPEIRYTGLAAAKALAIHEYWSARLEN
ncbi:MAG TPA: adenylosuccinate lyase [Candidatus Saccharimonadales bacterium]|nr:adenylosuccinate lyase [Candidatus Saccharimonadales bacterium]